MKGFNWKIITKNSKFVKIFSVTLCCILLCTSLSVFTLGLVKRFKANQPSDTEMEEVITYSTITYRAVEGDVVVYVEDSFFLNGRNYPTSYVDGSTVHIDDLRAIIYPNRNTDKEFRGWYLDSKCTIPFENDIERSGNFVVYAKITISYWTDPV